MDHKAKLSGLLSTSAMVVGSVGVANADADWSGFYAGAAYWNSSMDYEFDGYFGDYNDVSNAGSGGLFAGHNWQNGNSVFGVEINSSLSGISTNFSDYNTLRNVTDIRVRVGAAFGNALFYASGGLTGAVEFSEEYNYGQGAMGVNYGIGMDYALNDNIFVGLEYVSRVFNDGNYVDENMGALNTVAVRGGMRF